MRIKRWFDVLVSLSLLLLLAPLLIVLACMVRWQLGSPILFRQVRPGKDERCFMLIKFRTLVQACDKKGHLLEDSQRLHPFGQWMRRYSLDELPELLNVLRGEMSLVGPRPLLVEYLDGYTAQQRRRHEVRPGITGWAQINGRNDLSWEEKFALDRWYIDHWSFCLDLKILFLTPVYCLHSLGITPRGRVSVQKFIGQTRKKEALREHYERKH